MTGASVAFDGDDFLVAWSQASSGVLEVFAAQVSGDGTKVEPVGALSSTGDSRLDFRPSVAWNGSRFLVVWEHEFGPGDQDIQGRLVTRAGFPASGVFNVTAPTSNQTSPEVTAGGGTFMVVWTDARAGNLDVFRGRVANDSTRLDGSGVPVAQSTSVSEATPDVAWNGSRFLVAYERDSDSHAQLLDATGALVGSSIPVGTGADLQFVPKVASNGTDYLVVWQSGTDTSDVAGARVSSTGTVLGPVPVSSAPAQQDAPDVAFNGTYLVAWRDSRNGDDDLFAARVTSAGAIQDPNGFLVEAGTRTGALSFIDGPAVAPAPGSQRWAVDYDYNALTAIRQRVASK
jgi:hypothetical protein